MRRTIAKIATLDTIAKMGELKVRTLISEIKKEIKANADEEEYPEAKIDLMKILISDLEDGEDPEVVRKRFAELVKDVSPIEISQMEQRLLEEGLPEEHVRELCDVNVEVFQDSLMEREPPEAPSGHPVHTFMKENRAAENIIEDISVSLEELGPHPSKDEFKEQRKILVALLKDLFEIDKHYLRKENQLFPMLENHGISGPSQVMWAIHDDIRAMMKMVKTQVSKNKHAEVVPFSNELLKLINDMIYKEEHILFPVCMDVLTIDEWVRVKEGEADIGYAWVRPGRRWPSKTDLKRGKATKQVIVEGNELPLDTGRLSLEQINLLLLHLPVELTYVDENDEVVYFTAGEARIFERNANIIGRKVQKCHPTKTVKIVNKILSEFHNGTRDTSEFWYNKNERFIHITYFAVRDENGRYKGSLEVAQDVTDIRRLEFERRIQDWK
jgi:DUF438 domain-containing protein